MLVPKAVRVRTSAGWQDIALQGPPGPAGPPGSPAVQTTYIFTQTIAVSTWSIIHNLNCYPSVTVIDTGNSEIIPDVSYISSNEVRLSFANPTSGKAYLN